VLFAYLTAALKASALLPEWIRQYKSGDFRFDLVAGLTVGVMLIPQAMAYAMLAGIPPIYGLYASTFPAIIYGFLGSCRQLSIGPTAMVSMLTASGGSLVAQNDPNTFLLIVAAITLIAGLMQFLLGVGRLGFLVQFLSKPVLLGFTSAAAIIIGLSQGSTNRSYAPADISVRIVLPCHFTIYEMEVTEISICIAGHDHFHYGLFRITT